MRVPLRYLVIAVAALLSLVSCHRPKSMEDFILAGEARKVGGYIFDVDMTDSLCTYNLDFYTRLDARRSDLGVLQDYPLQLTWISPDGQRSSQTIYLDITQVTNQTFFSRQLVIPFMEDLSPKQPGIWQLKVSVPDVVAEKGMRGFGLVTKRVEK